MSETPVTCAWTRSECGATTGIRKVSGLCRRHHIQDEYERGFRPACPECGMRPSKSKSEPTPCHPCYKKARRAASTAVCIEPGCESTSRIRRSTGRCVSCHRRNEMEQGRWARCSALDDTEHEHCQEPATVRKGGDCKGHQEQRRKNALIAPLAPRPRSISDVEARADVAIWTGCMFLPLAPFTDTKTPWEGLCLQCGERCSPRYGDLRNGGGHCKPCAIERRADAQRHGDEDARAVMEAAGFEPLEQYPGSVDSPWLCECNECGAKVSPTYNNVQRGGGCRNCAKTGYKPTKPGALYLLARTVDGREQRQFGISNSVEDRVRDYKRFGWAVIDTMHFDDGELVWELEAMLKRVISTLIGRTVEPDSVYYRCFEAYSDGHGVPIFDTLTELLAWAEPFDDQVTFGVPATLEVAA